MEHLRITHGAHLPHWTRERAIYGVTFRLGDSLPASVLSKWIRERDSYIERVLASKKKLTEFEQIRVDTLHSLRIQKYLDAGHGDCLLRDARAALVVRDALAHFDGQRYRIAAWCVMPNHVHVVVQPTETSLPKILHTWKSYTSHSVNKVLGRTGSLWQVEYYDRLLRDEAELRHALRYIAQNPEKAGLKNWPWVGLGFGAPRGKKV
ncbi:MAG TPA: transposase [Planctomycetota bacterium]|nr:transposase [Planctomycetota bacterium]